MSLPLLQTKFYVPTLRTGLVARPQLLARLANNDLPPLTLISAPAGFGKTTLVSEWVQTSAELANIPHFRETSGSRTPPLVAR